MFVCRWFRATHIMLLLAFVSGTLLANAAGVSNSTRPLVFEPNQGQAPSDARYLLHDGPMEALFRKNGVRLALPQSSGSALDLGIEFVDADPDPTITGISPLEGHSNYLLGNDPSRWLRGIPNYAQGFKLDRRTFVRLVDSPIAGSGDKESATQRRARVKKRVQAEKNRGNKAFLKTVAEDEKISVTRLKQLLNDEPKPRNDRFLISQRIRWATQTKPNPRQ